MLYGGNKYSDHLLQKSMLCFALMLFFMIPVSAQVEARIHTSQSNLNPLLLSSFKKPVKANPLLAEYIKPGKHELMYWPNFPLNAAQIEARRREWERKYNRPIGEQIVGDMVNSYINFILYGKKQVVAVRPKF